MQVIFSQELIVPDFAKALFEIKNNKSHFNISDKN